MFATATMKGVWANQILKRRYDAVASGGRRNLRPSVSGTHHGWHEALINLTTFPRVACLAVTRPSNTPPISSAVNLCTRIENTTALPRVALLTLARPAITVPMLPTIHIRAQVGLAPSSAKATNALTRKRHRPAALGRLLDAHPAVLADPVAQLARVHRAGLGRPVGSDSCRPQSRVT